MRSKRDKLHIGPVDSRKQQNSGPVRRIIRAHNSALREEKADEIREKEYLRSVKMRKSTQMTLPIQDVFNGCVLLKDGTYSKIIELSPTNFILKPPAERAATINRFANLLRISPDRLHFKSISKRANIERFIDTLKEEQRIEKVPKCKAMHLDQMQLIKNVSEEDSVSRRFFCILTLDPKYDRNTPKDVYEVTAQLNREARELEEQFKQIGNIAVEVDPGQEDTAVLEILYSFICRRQSSEQPYQDHARKIVQAYCTEANVPLDSPPYISATEFIAPDYIDFSHSDYYVIDGMYYMTGYVPSNKFPPNGVVSGWTSPFVNAGEGIDVDIWLERKDKNDIQTQINRTITHSRLSMQSEQDTTSNYEIASSAVNTGFYLKDGFKAGQDFYYMCMMVTVSSETLEGARYIFKELQRMGLQNDIRIQPANFHQEEAFNSTLPCGWISKFFFSKGKQNVLTLDAASSYIYTSYSMCDSNGIFLGVNEQNNTPTLIDLFNTDLYRNANIAILGSSGAGKTFTTQCISLRLRLKQYAVYCIIPKKGIEFKPACDAVGGQYMIISGASPHCINILQIRKPNNDVMKLLYGDGIEQSLLAQKIQSVKNFFTLLFPNISLSEMQGLDIALIRTYEKKGITRDNQSLIEPSDPSKFKEMPILEDLYKVLRETNKMERVADILEPLVYGSAASFNGHTNVDLDNLYMVFDLDYLSKELLPVGMYVVLDFVWDKIKEDKTKRKAVIMDELWALIGANANKTAADYVLNIFKLIRGYGGAAICSTQDLNDFFAYEDGAYGKGIINACKFKFVLGLEEEEAKRVQDILELDNSEIELVKSFRRGKGLICVNHNNVAVDFRASDTEYELFSTDPKVLSEIAARRRRQRSMVM